MTCQRGVHVKKYLHRHPSIAPYAYDGVIYHDRRSTGGVPVDYADTMVAVAIHDQWRHCWGISAHGILQIVQSRT